MAREVGRFISFLLVYLGGRKNDAPTRSILLYVPPPRYIRALTLNGGTHRERNKTSLGDTKCPWGRQNSSVRNPCSVNNRLFVRSLIPNINWITTFTVYNNFASHHTIRNPK